MKKKIILEKRLPEIDGKKYFRKNENERFSLINLWVEVKKILLNDKMCREPSGHNAGIRHSLSATQVEPDGFKTSALRALGGELPE